MKPRSETRSTKKLLVSHFSFRPPSTFENTKRPAWGAALSVFNYVFPVLRPHAFQKRWALSLLSIILIDPVVGALYQIYASLLCSHNHFEAAKRTGFVVKLDGYVEKWAVFIFRQKFQIDIMLNLQFETRIRQKAIENDPFRFIEFFTVLKSTRRHIEIMSIVRIP